MKKKPKQYEDVDASPVKRFFVEMLTRDISLSDSVLDLLDNCVDGILRQKPSLRATKPYAGKYAHIEFSSDKFSISDNCGGIPWSLHAYAFHMGRPENHIDKVKGSVGTYGIGMKRAIFKIGKECTIQTRSGEDEYEIRIDEAWMKSPKWLIPVASVPGGMEQDGTKISITELHPGVSTLFGVALKSFVDDFIRKVQTHYAFIIEKGLEVKVNGQKLTPRPTRLLFSDSHKESIRPFIYKDTIDGVKVFLAVGFSRPLPTPLEVNDDQEGKQYSTLDAGWTVVCNDRAVLYCDKTELTGWGEAGVPQYHTQFIAISGIVEFSCDDPSKLPTTTTKRGIDSSSRVYLQVKNKMREGMLIFIRFTNKWKSELPAIKRHMNTAKLMDLGSLRKALPPGKFRSLGRSTAGQQYMPNLPLPVSADPSTCRISYTRPTEEVNAVADYLNLDGNQPNKVGEKCFELYLTESKG